MREGRGTILSNRYIRHHMRRRRVRTRRSPFWNHLPPYAPGYEPHILIKLFSYRLSRSTGVKSSADRPRPPLRSTGTCDVAAISRPLIGSTESSLRLSHCTITTLCPFGHTSDFQGHLSDPRKHRCGWSHTTSRFSAPSRSRIDSTKTVVCLFKAAYRIHSNIVVVTAAALFAFVCPLKATATTLCPFEVTHRTFKVAYRIH